ncbi:LysR family transcriptional regulator [Granulosicoccus sp. 3-233]|uniref:LysR family transcriptional regulator n=1 Tax=Granulosicoccus sp. 3-233 TaxID=3417969 RepID=UPI003D335722
MTDVLTGMRVFVTVVDTGSFAAAAEKLDLSRGMTSRYVAQMESHLGVRLLNRTTRKLSLTGVGQDYYQRAVQVLGLVEEAETAATSETAQPRGTLRINAPLSFSALHLGHAITEYLQRFQDVQVELSLVDREVKLVEEGFDLALRIANEVDPMLIARPLAPVRVVACASARYLETHGMPEHPRDLARHNCLRYTNTRNSDEWHFHRGPEQCQVAVQGNLQGNNGDVLCNAAVAGLGVVLQPTFMVYQLLNSGALLRVLDGWEPEHPTLNAVYANRRFLPLKTRSFIDFLVEYFAGKPYWDEGL